MAKKKKKKTAKKWLDVVGIVLGLAAIAMMFLPTIGIKTGDEVAQYTGIQAVFGYTKVAEIGSATIELGEIFSFSILGFLPYLVIAGAVVLLILNVIGKGGKLTNIIALPLFVAGAVLAYYVGSFLVPGDLIAEAIKWEVSSFTLLYGGILTVVLATLASVASTVKILLK